MTRTTGLTPHMRHLVPALCMLGCGSDQPANVAGDYMTIVTNGENGCNFDQWTVGASNPAAVTVTQSGNNLTATVNGAAGVILNLAIGGNVYTGHATGSTLNLDLFGTR